jgi:sporulation protein YlmC with PRC-barrel domain
VGVTLDGHRVDASGHDLWHPFVTPAFHRLEHDWPIVPARVETILRHLARTGLGHAPAQIRENVGQLAEEYPDQPDTDDDVIVRMNAIAVVVFDCWIRSRGQPASVDAPILADRLLAAMTDLAHWAAYGALGLIEEEEFERAAGSVVEAATLLRRSHPWMHSVINLNQAISYCEEVVLPYLGLDGDVGFDEEALVAASMPAVAIDAPRLHRARDVIGSAVFTDDGTRLGRVEDLAFGDEGGIASVMVSYRGGTVAVPFRDMRIEVPERHDQRWRLVIARGLTEAWAAGMKAGP